MILEDTRLNLVYATAAQCAEHDACSGLRGLERHQLDCRNARHRLMNEYWKG